jgi:hypothetical protein
VHDDIEWLARPVTSLSWFFSLAICHMEAARDVAHNFVQRTFWMCVVILASLIRI